MRGQVLDYDTISGTGLISGDDGRRYAFGPDGIGSARGLRVGAQVDFEIRDGAATGVFPIFSGPEPRPTEPDLGLWGYFVKCMKLYFNGHGRATRKEYWSFILFRFLFMFGTLMTLGIGIAIFAAAAYAQDYDSSAAGDALGLGWWLLNFIIGLPFMAPHFTVSIRRLHDVGLSGWLVLLMPIWIIGPLFMFIIALLPSQPGRNQYDLGPDTGVFR